ncbi:hypothetical protein BsBEST3102_06680 [Bacillus subtilis]|nr:hypothetical protein NBRC13719_06990 [Bacillus subtilis subsp. subtilis]BCV69658.1 hypothetical protein BsBEST3095_06790 [Bacillus subtilis]BCV73879.1 hypothetical protein BsBEST3096_06810 [Bacillus subtilis]BCV78108.1 hypothetical protein BsBEST3102_06680 [Bacillus subtilis]BCV82343.1 hypothetical protein BsBEST3106_06710 [Bacillus subtilis]
MFWWKNESFGMCLYSWRDWRKHGRNDIDCYTFFGSLYSILFFKEHVDDEKTDYIWFISFNGMCHPVCSVCSVTQ